MENLKKVSNLYRQTGALLVVLVVLTGSIVYVLVGPLIFNNSSNPNQTANKSSNPILKTAGGQDCIGVNSSLDSEEQNFVTLLNNYRQANGLSPVTTSSSLSEMAQWYAEDMANKNYFNTNHIDSLGRGVSANDGSTKRISDCGIATFNGEILAAGRSSAQEAIDQFKNSPSHNAIMLQANNVQVGVGRANKAGSQFGWYWVAEFDSANDGSSAGSGGGTSGGSSGGSSGGACAPDTLCSGWNIPGNDFYSYPSATEPAVPASAQSCKDACYLDNNCQAWTYVNAGTGGSYNGQATCYEKTSTNGGFVLNSNTTSGYRATAGGGSSGGTSGGGSGVGACGVNTSVMQTYCQGQTNGQASWNDNACYCQCGNGTLLTAGVPVTACNPASGGGSNNGGSHITPSPSVSPSPSITQPPSVTPSVSPAPGNGTIQLFAAFGGIGGNTQMGENPHPVRTQIAGQINVDGTTQDVQLNFSASDFKFTAQPTVKTGTYDLKLRTNNSLWKDLGFVTVTSQSGASAPSAVLATGDLNQDNTLNLLDYNIFLSCFGAKSCGQKQQADLNLDGKVDEVDINIFLSNLSNRTGD